MATEELEAISPQNGRHESHGRDMSTTAETIHFRYFLPERQCRSLPPKTGRADSRHTQATHKLLIASLVDQIIINAAAGQC